MPINTKRSRYSSGKAGGIGQFEVPEERRQYTPSSRRGSGVRGRGIDTGAGAGRGIRGRSGAARDIKSEKPAATAQPPESSGTTGRGDTRQNPNGVVQTGTSMSGRVMTMDEAQKMLGGDVKIHNPFASNGLPTTNVNDYSADDAVTMGASPDEAATIAKGGFVEVDLDAEDGIETKMVQGSPNLVKAGGGKANDINDPSTWDENYARRRAFLDADDSMAGIKAVRAQKGMVYAGGQYNMVNPNAGKEGESDFFKVDTKDANAYMRGAQGAEDLKAKYVDEITTAKAQSFEGIGDKPIAAQQTESPVDMTAEAKKVPEGLTDMPQFSDKDHTGRFNIYR